MTKKCHPDKTLLENRIYALSDHFEMACIAGPWSFDTTFDNILSTYNFENRNTNIILRNAVMQIYEYIFLNNFVL